MSPTTDAVRVALLGCGVVGSQVVRLLDEQADDLAARIGAPLELAGIAVRRPARHTDVPADLLTTDAEALVAATTSTSSSRSSAASSRPARCCWPRSTAARAWSAPTRRCSPRTAPTLHDAAAAGRRRPVLRGRGRRRHPAAAPAARVPRRRPHHPGDGHRQRHHQLHPLAHGRHRRGLRRGAGRGHRAGLRRGRPDRRRRRLRRRGQGRDPGRAGLPHPGHRCPTSTARASARSAPPTSPAPGRMGCTVKLLAICERVRTPTAASGCRCACTRR